MHSLKNSTYRHYIKSIRVLPRLCETELSQIIELYRLTNSLTARNTIIEYYLPLIPQVIDMYASSGLDIMDIIQIANLCLIEVIDKYLLNSNIRDIPAYIVKSVSHEILRAIRKEETRL